MEDVRDKAEKKRDAPDEKVGNTSSVYMLSTEADDAPRPSKSPRRVGQPDTYSLVSGAASNLSLVTPGQSSSGVGSSWMMVEQPPGGLATLGGLSPDQKQLALVSVGNAGIGVNTFPGKEIVSFNLASGEGSSALSRVQQEILKNQKENLTKDWEAERLRTQLYMAKVEQTCNNAINTSLTEAQEARQQSMAVKSQANDMSVSYANMESNVFAFQNTMNLQALHMRQHSEREQLFKHQAVI